MSNRITRLFLLFKALLATVVGGPKPEFVCGTDGNTYIHPEYIRVGQCENFLLGKKKDGPCSH